MEVPDLPPINLDRLGHAAVDHHLVKLAGGDADVHGTLLAAQAAPRNRSRLGEGAAHGLSHSLMRSPRSSSGPAEMPGGPRRGLRRRPSDAARPGSGAY